MPGLTFLYRSGKNLVDRQPSWLLRCRPFAIYEITLPRSFDEPATTSSRVVCQVRWIVDAAEAARLRPLAGVENIAALDFTTRRVAAAWLDGQVVACAFVATDSFDERDLGLRFELQHGEAWLSAATVDAQQRNRGVYGQLLEFLIRELTAGGVRRILLGVTVGNEPSRRAHARHGAVPVGGVLAVRSLGLTLCRRSGRVRRLSPLPASWRQPIRLAVDR